MQLKYAIPARRGHREAGFTLIELLITLVIVSVGLLGVAKLQAAAVAETAVARTRSLMTFQAEALASNMRANKAFWQSSSTYSQTVTIPAASTGNFTQSPSNLVIPTTSDTTCVSTSSCSAANLAYDDMRTWAKSFGARFPAATGSISCTGSATVPVSCDITLNWTERTVAINRSTAAGPSQNASTMVLHVQP